MTPEQWQRVRPILESALDLEVAERLAFLEAACPDSSIRMEVESLLASHEEAGSNVLNPASPVRVDWEEEARYRLPAGKRIGAYEIVQEIGMGGMGAIYSGVRADGEYRQQVALKIVRAELGVEFTAARFKNERQILASLDHPNIAKILDGGTTVEGVPYLVMELIDGLPITEYCDKHRLTIDARLKLFRTACAAVHYAHQHLVIHRDIKPGNILVTSEGVPKLLDFGIAKILEPSALGGTAATAAGLGMMTPEYASPEQLRGETITTATDAYSLGLVLYELLAGRRAYRLVSRLPHEIAHAVLETDPEKPSTAIRPKETPGEEGGQKAARTPEEIGGLRGDSPEKLCRRLEGDLDNIVLKAIRKEPQGRYTSADQLSDDIRRHLEGLPVAARKSTIAYRCQKYVLRHKVGAAAAALVFLSLVGGIVLTLREARIARANELRAERRFNDVRKLANSLIFEVYDSVWQLPGATAARLLTIQRAQEYLDSLAQESASDPSLLRELAAAYSRLASVQGNGRDVNFGDTRKALENWRKAAALLESAASLQSSDHDIRRELARAYLNVALGFGQVGETAENETYVKKAMQILEPLAAANAGDLEIQYALAKAYEQSANFARHQNDLVRALESYQKANAIYERLGAAQPENQQFQREISFSHKHLGGTLREQNLLAEALEHERAALAIDEAQLARNPESVQDRYNVTFTYNDTALILGKQGDLDGALAYYHKALEIRTALAAADPRDDRTREGISNTLNYIGDVLLQKKDYGGALDSYKKALAIRQALSQKDPANERLRFKRSFTESNIGMVYAQMALRKTAEPADELKYCRDAKKWIGASWPTWMERKSQGKLEDDAEAFVQIEQNLEECSRVIARLDRAAKSPAH